MASSQPVPVDRSQVEKAAKALLKHLEIKKREKADDSTSQLFEEDDTVLLVITLKKIPDRGLTKPFLIPLKHSLYTEDPEICIFVKDPKEPQKAVLEEQKAKVAKVISLSKLGKGYRQFEERRKLVNSYQLFLADERIIPLLPRVTGKTFFKRKKQPVPVNMTRNINAQIARIKSSTLMFISAGSTIVVKVGLSSFTPEQVVENIMFSLEHIVQRIKGGWKNVQALHLKSTDSIALPMYASLPKGVLRVTADAPSSETKALPASASAASRKSAAAIESARPEKRDDEPDEDDDDDEEEDDEIQVKSVHRTITVKSGKKLLLPPPPKGQDSDQVVVAHTNPGKRKSPGADKKAAAVKAVKPASAAGAAGKKQPPPKKSKMAKA